MTSYGAATLAPIPPHRSLTHCSGVKAGSQEPDSKAAYLAVICWTHFRWCPLVDQCPPGSPSLPRIGPRSPLKPSRPPSCATGSELLCVTTHGQLCVREKTRGHKTFLSAAVTVWKVKHRSPWRGSLVNNRFTGKLRLQPAAANFR